jgi:glycosyltransferase involved in cell wall biosynthesis
MAHEPPIHIVLATFNPDTRFFRRQIDSIREQTHRSWHCLVTDDGSTEDSLSSITQVLGDDPRFSLQLHSQRVGSYFNFERGLKAVPPTAALIALCDQDDLWKPNKLERMVQAFDRNEIVLAHSDLTLIDKEERVLHASCWEAEKRAVDHYSVPLLLLRNTVTGCASVFRRQLLDSAIPFPKTEGERLFHHDLWLALVAVQLGGIESVREPLVLYRQHGANVVGASTPQLRMGSKADPKGLMGKIDAKLTQAIRDYSWRKSLAASLPKKQVFTPGRAWLENCWHGHRALWIASRLILGKWAAYVCRERR